MSIEYSFAPLNHPLGKRINVRGGGGKSTLSAALANKLSVPHIELDSISHLPNWASRDIPDFRAETLAAIERAGDRWIVDGNYTGDLEDLVLKRADTVMWLDLPWRVIFRRILLRSFARAIDKRKICGDNTESWRRIFSRDSLWWWYIRNRKQLIRRGERFLPMVPQGVPVIRIGSGRELHRFYEIHGLVR